MKKSMYTSQRFLLTMMAFTGLVNAYLMRLCLNVAILKMINPRDENITRMIKYTSSSMMDVTQIVDVLDPNEKYDWSEATEGLIKSSFFIGYALLHVPGSFLGQKYGGKIVLNIGLLLTAFCTLLTPIVVHFGGADGLIVLRFIMGIGEAPAYPALIYLLSCWIPEKERGRVSSIVFCAGQIGAIICYLLTGFVIQYVEGYASIFYIFGVISLIWNISFHFLVYDRPSNHPRISANEREYLKEEIGELVVTKSFFEIPWSSMLTSPAVIVLIIAQMGHDWGFYILATEMPDYLNRFLRFDFKDVAIYTALPFSASYVCSLIFGIICDFIVSRKVVTLTQARKIFTAIGALVAAVFIIAISYGEYDWVAVVAYFILAMSTMSGFYTGAQANFLDLCPNYSGALMGLVNGTGAVCGFLVPFLTGLLTTECDRSKDPNCEKALLEWRKMFWIAFGVLSVTLFTYLIWGSAEVQSWNNNYEDDWMKRLYRRYFVQNRLFETTENKMTEKNEEETKETERFDENVTQDSVNKN